MKRKEHKSPRKSLLQEVELVDKSFSIRSLISLVLFLFLLAQIGGQSLGQSLVLAVWLIDKDDEADLEKTTTTTSPSQTTSSSSSKVSDVLRGILARRARSSGDMSPTGSASSVGTDDEPCAATYSGRTHRIESAIGNISKSPNWTSEPASSTMPPGRSALTSPD